MFSILPSVQNPSQIPLCIKVTQAQILSLSLSPSLSFSPSLICKSLCNFVLLFFPAFLIPIFQISWHSIFAYAVSLICPSLSSLLIKVLSIFIIQFKSPPFETLSFHPFQSKVIPLSSEPSLPLLLMTHI